MQPESPVDAIVLAAGRSTRMGEPKPLLRTGDETFIEHAVRMLHQGGCRVVVAVVNEDADWTQRLADATGALVVINDDPAAEQIDSVRAGLRHVHAEAVAVLPVDHPALRADTVRALIDAYRSTGSAIVRPVHGGTPGHPTIFAGEALHELLQHDLEHGARSVIDADPSRVLDVPVDDPGVALDVNTPADYRRLS